MSPFLAWGDFHARSRFARSTIPEEKWGTTRSLTTPWNYNKTRLLKLNISDILTLNFLLCASDLIIPWCPNSRNHGPSVPVALKIALGSSEHHGIKTELATLNSKVIVFFKKIVTLEVC